MRYPGRPYRNGERRNGAPGSQRMSPAFLAPVALPAAGAAAATAVAAPVAAGASSLALPILGGFAIGVGIGLVLWEMFGGSDPWDGATHCSTTMPACPGWGYYDAGWIPTNTDWCPLGAIICSGGTLANLPLPSDWTGYHGAIHLWARDVNPGVSVRYKVDEAYYHPTETPGVAPGDVTLVPGYGTPERVDNEEPEYYPIFKPIWVPTPQRWADAKAKPGTQPSVQPAVPTLPEMPPPFPAVVTPPNVLPPAQRVDVRPGFATIPATANAGRYKPKPKLEPKFNNKPNADNPTRTRNRTKDRKIHTGKYRLWHLMNGLTEAFDFIDALYKALPKECRPKAKKPALGKLIDQWGDENIPSVVLGNIRKNKPKALEVDPYQKLKAIYKCWDHMDVAKAVENFVNNQIEDMFFGAQGMALTAAQRKFGIATGLNTAVANANKQWTSGGMDGDKDNDIKVPLPELDYDEKTGVWNWTWDGHTVVGVSRDRAADFGIDVSFGK